MTPAQARALLGDDDDDDDDAPRKRGGRKPASRGEGWTTIRNQEDLDAALAGAPRKETTP